MLHFQGSDPCMTKQSYNATLLCKRTILQASASYTQLTPLTPVKTDMSSHANENKELICICKIVIKLNMHAFVQLVLF